jgi:hypothetical protein
MMSYVPARRGKRAQVRLHRMFLSAPPEILDALVNWINGRRKRTAGRLLDDFIESRRYLIRRKTRPIRAAHTTGQFHDLAVYYEDVNVNHFENAIDSGIMWGRLPTVRNRRSIRLGSYTPEDDLIRIHPHLDQSFVPDYFVRYIVFHEMLHAHLGYETTPTGRRRVHTPEFNRIERAYPDYERAMAWHNHPRNLSRVMRPLARSA